MGRITPHEKKKKFTEAKITPKANSHNTHLPALSLFTLSLPIGSRCDLAPRAND